MIPISDDNPVRLKPWVNWSLIGTCVGVFVWELSLGSQLPAALDVLGFAPDSLMRTAARLPGYVVVPPWITIFTAMFLHGGWLHIAGNMLYLWIFGNNIEDAMGHWRYLAFYLLCGVAAAFSFAAMAPGSNIPMVGASGAISGVLAAYVLLYPRALIRVVVPLGILPYFLRISAGWVVGFWFVMQLVNAVLARPGDPGVAWWAHVGGFLVGGLLTPLFKSSHVPLFGNVRRGPWG
ncbi:MAG: rhomboid family intramembrane serine protease [Alphaproteobacteria bacterium]|nr:rhomboid family intramembrane serine protease [Alphaproteobacteria bacterium]